MPKFYKTLLKIAIPVTLQSMLQASFSIIDQVMIGQLGEASISSVGLCGNFTLIFTVIIGAVSTVAGILMAQFIGSDDKREAWCSFWVSALTSIIISSLFFLSSFLFTKNILSLYTKDFEVIDVGQVYFKIIAFTYIPMAIANIVSSYLRCIEHATIPFISSFISVLINTSLNYMFIFNYDMGIKGAALATLISQLVNLLFIIIGFIYITRKDKPIVCLKFNKLSLNDYLIMIFPILISEFLWSLGQNVESSIYGHLSTSSLAAYTLTCPIQGLFVGALSGLSAAAAIMIGKQLGKKDYDGAYNDSKKIMYLGLVLSICISFILMIFAGNYTNLYKVDNYVKDIGKTILIIFALYAPVKVENMILGGGIIRSGGNTKLIMIIDIIGTWCVGIPLCLIATYIFKWDIVGIYALLTTEEVFRLIVSLIVFKKRKWLISLS